MMLQAKELPTLLFSKAERQAIQQARNAQPGTENKQTLVRYSGMVQRVTGKNTVWMNEQALQQGELSFPAVEGKKIIVQGQNLHVGDQFDMVNGIVKDLLPPETMQKKK